MNIDIEKINSLTFRVKIGGEHPSQHRVSVSAEDYESLTGGNATHEKLISESFAFLLERESNTSILSEFRITDIARYFPEYPKDIAERLKSN